MESKCFDRRYVLAAGTMAALSGCQSSQASLTQSVASRNRRLQAAVLVGAGLGFAVARSRGGSEIVGLALGAFAGATVHAAVAYARTILERNDNDVSRSFSSLGDAAIQDGKTFLSENAPLIEERSAIINGIKNNSRSVNLSNILSRLRDLEELERRRTIPTRVYSQAAPIYPQSVVVLPKVAGLEASPPSSKEERDYADDAGRENLSITRQYVQINNDALRTAQALGIDIS